MQDEGDIYGDSYADREYFANINYEVRQHKATKHHIRKRKERTTTEEEDIVAVWARIKAKDRSTFETPVQNIRRTGDTRRAFD